MDSHRNALASQCAHIAMRSHRNVLAARLARSAISLERMSPNYHGPGPQ